MDTIKIKKGNILMVAHGGLAGLELENTGKAFENAGKYSHFAIETDFRVTADGKFVTIHDDTTKRLTGKDLKVAECTLEQLLAMDLIHPGTGEICEGAHFAALEEFITICKKYNKVAIPDLKELWSEEDLRHFIETVGKFDYLDNTVLITFYWENIEKILSIRPNQRVQYIRFKDCSDEDIELMIKHGVEADLAHPWLKKEIVDRLHQGDIKVNCWNVDTVEDAERVIACGVDYITSNFLE